MPEKKVEKLVALLEPKSLNYIEVIPFELDDADVAEEDDDDDNEHNDDADED